jgi:hypothetical protein
MSQQFEQVRRPFTESELATMKDQLVVEVGNVKELRGEKAQATTTLNASIKTTEKGVWDLQERIALGYETIDVEVVSVLDRPEPGRKQIVRADTGQVLRVEVMTLAERQSSFGFERPEG